MKRETKYDKLIKELHMPETQRLQLRGELIRRMERKEPSIRSNRVTYKFAGIVAVVMIGIIGCLGFLVSQPAIAAKIPILNSIFAMVEGKSEHYPGSYSGKGIKVTSENVNKNGVYEAEASQIRIKVSEVYSDGNSVYVSAEIESDTADFASLQKYAAINPPINLITIKGYMQVEGEAEKYEFTAYEFEGEAIDKNTFAGMVRFDIFHDEQTKGILNVDLYQICYQVNPSGKTGAARDVCIDGDWSLRIPYKVDPEAVDRYNIDKVCGKKCEISHVDVSDEQIVVYSNKNYGIQVFDQNGNEIQGFYAGSESNNRAVAFPIDADTREKISVLKVYAFSRTKDGLDRYMKSNYEERTEKAAKELSDISATVKLEK